MMSTEAIAQERSADIELVRPVLSPRSPLGIDGMAIERPGTVRAGLVAQYAANPLVLEQVGADELKVVANRATAQLVVSADASERVSLRANLPVATSWGSNAPDFGVDGFGLGDLSGGVRVAFLQTDNVSFGGHADLTIPTGRRDAWMGERGMRLGGGLGTTVDAGKLSLSANAGVLGRSLLETAGLDLGTQMYGGAGLHWALSEAIAAQAGAVGRFGFSAGSNAAEALLGARVSPNESLSFDLIVGHGLSNGIGATDARLAGGITYRRPGPEPTLGTPVAELPAVIDDFMVLPEEEEAGEDLAALAPPPEWKPEELARVGRGQVELRDPIKFQVGTAEILPESKDILEQVAEIMATTPEIIHVVIVGHASNEGSFETNYAISLDRATSVYEELLKRGVHPDRLSVRAMGEITPVGVAADDEAARRVEFRITRALGANEQAPEYSPIDQLPFNGEQRPQRGGK